MRPLTRPRQKPSGTAPHPGAVAAPVHARRLAHLPDLAPAATIPAEPEPVSAPPTLEQVFRFTRASAQDESTDFRKREEARDPCAFLTVYALNAAIMLFAFPVGFALLVFNILGGENLRTTAHVMALTGLACTLPTLGLSVPFLT